MKALVEGAGWRRVRFGVGLALVGALVTVVGHAPAAVGATLVQRVTTSSTGGDANGDADRPHLSNDGTHVAFDTEATNVDGLPDTNTARDVFVQDLTTGQVQRASVGYDGSQANDYSTLVSISDDGRYLAFQSLATNLVPNDVNGQADVFWRDMTTGETRLVSVSRTGGGSNGSSTRPSISGDGRYVAFNSSAGNLITGDTNKLNDIYVRDMVGNTTTLASVAVGGGPGNGSSVRPEMRGAGRYVAFESYATNLVLDDHNGLRDIFLRDLLTGTTSRVSVSSTGGDASKDSSRPHLTEDGRYVAFQSGAPNIVDGDTNAKKDVFVRDMLNGTTILASRSSSGELGRADSTRPVLSPEGRYLAFNSYASNLVPGDTNGQEDVFLLDLQTGFVKRISVSTTGGGPDGWSYRPEISRDAAVVVFRSAATNLVFGDGNGKFDIFAVHPGDVGADTSAPDGTVTSPSAGAKVTSGQVSFNGGATDDHGIGSVGVSIKDRATGLWLQPDGSWAGPFAKLPATLANPGQPSTGWTWSGILADGSYTLQLTTMDTSGNADPTKPNVLFTAAPPPTGPVDTVPADGTITSPTAAQVLDANAVTFQGGATDDVAVGAVAVSVKDRTTGLWLAADGTWATTVTKLPATLTSPAATSTDWSWSGSLPNGRYLLQVAASDTSGNTDPTKPSVLFSVAVP